MHEYLMTIRKRFPRIRPYEEDDFEWQNEAKAAERGGNTKLAEELYMKLTISQPHHHAGTAGLGRVYTRTDPKRARFFFNMAVSLAQKMVVTGDMDPELFQELCNDRDAVSTDVT